MERNKERRINIPVPLQKVRKNEEPVYPLRSKAPGGTYKYPFQKTESSDILNWNGYTFEHDRNLWGCGAKFSGAYCLRGVVLPVGITLLISLLTACGPAVKLKQPETALPESYMSPGSSLVKAEDQLSGADKSQGSLDFTKFFKDQELIQLISEALENNQELNIFQQELKIARNEISARQGAYLPFVDYGGMSGFDKSARYTRFGALEANTQIKRGTDFPEPLGNYALGFRATWELDIWRKLRNQKDAAVARYLSTVNGRNFVITNLVAEIASAYYELKALDNQLQIVNDNVQIQQRALDTVRLEKQGARVTELAVLRFEAQVLRTESLKYAIQQRIVQTENRINFLAGRFPRAVARSKDRFLDFKPWSFEAGVPGHLLESRADIRQAELALTAAGLDVKSAKAAFYPSLNITGEVGYEAFRVSKLFTSPESFLYNLAAGLTGPLINRRAITADLKNANAKQVQAAWRYEQAILNGFIESATQLSNLSNLASNVDFRTKQVDTLTRSIDIASTLFTSARADYSEVLLTQREAIEAKFELVETKIEQVIALVNLYRSLGGGWQCVKHKENNDDQGEPGSDLAVCK